MTVQQAIMSNGQWQVTLDENTPVAVTDRPRDPFSLLRIYPTRIPTTSVAGTTPLYTGLWLRSPDRTSCEGAGPLILLGGAGTPSNKAGYLSQGSAWGPNFGQPGSPGSLNQYVTAICGKNGINTGYVGGDGSNHLSFVNGTSARDWLENWIVPQWGVEYRVTPSLFLEVGTIAQLYGTAAKAIVTVPDEAGPDPGALPGLTATKLDAELDFTSYRSRVIADWAASDGTSGRNDTGPPASSYHVNGQALEWAEWLDGFQDSASASTGANWRWVADGQPARSLDVEVNDPDLAGLAPTLVGSYIDVYDPRRELYDTSNPVTYRGHVIYPTKVRCTGVTWPIRRGMGVFLDNTANGGVVTDLTDYVQFEEPKLTLTIGALPVGLNGQRRPIHA